MLMAIGLALMILAATVQWHEIHAHYLERQHSLVRLISNASHSLFVTQEMMLDILGAELIQDRSFGLQVKSKRILDDLLILNPSIVAFGLATPSGELTFVSSNLNRPGLPNLKEQPVSSDSFRRALGSTNMVLGRTYYLEVIKEWVIPIRKAIRNADGDVVSVMTAGLRVSGASRLFTDALHFGPYHSILIIRDVDLYQQFHSGGDADLEKIYSQPLPAPLMEGIEAALAARYNLSLPEIMASGEVYDIEVQNGRGHRVMAVVKYDGRYMLWTVSQVEHWQLELEFLQVLGIYVLIFLLIGGVIFLLMRTIARAEERRRQELIAQATHDPLTGLPNRTYLQQRIREWIHGEAPPFSLFFIDMDHFKSVNDSFGHQFGDAVLRELAGRLRRLGDERSLIVRQASDEFLMLSDRVETPYLLAYAQHLTETLSTPCTVDNVSVTLGVSIGIARYPEHGTDLDMLLRAADIAMYESKRLKHSFHLFSSAMQEGYLNRLDLERHLRTALAGHEFVVVYQPQVDAQGGFVGVESLLRWNSPELGPVVPASFIPVAEASGMMPALGEFVLTRTLTEMRQLQERLGRTWRVSLNISVRQFMQINFLEELKRIIDDAGISGSLVTLEITESLFIEDVDYILHILDSVHRLGVRISMDDFGTGYSSLSMLRILPIDELKIDKGFIDTILNDQAARKMIRNIISIGKNLEMSVLAEGVETVDQEHMLKSYGCDLFQGFLYARPMVAAELEERVRNWPCPD